MNGAKERIVLLLEVEDTDLSGLVSRHSRPGVQVLTAQTEAQARRILESERVAVVIAQEILPLELLQVLSELTLAMTSPPSLVVIREERSRFGKGSALVPLHRAIEARQVVLERAARSIGCRVHGEKPRRFGARVERLWEIWRRERGS